MNHDRRAFSVAIYARRKGTEVLAIFHRRLATWLPVGGELEPGETPTNVRQFGFAALDAVVVPRA